jgi:hypothetical protein
MAETLPRLLPNKSIRWHMLHSMLKPLLRIGIAVMFRCIKGAYEKKVREGWINPECGILHDEMEEIIRSNWRYNKKMWIGESMCGHIGHLNYKDKDVKMWTKARAIACTLLDEDSYYLLRWFQLLDIQFRDQEKFRLEMHKKRAYWNWQEIRDLLQYEEEQLQRKKKYGIDKLEGS